MTATATHERVEDRIRIGSDGVVTALSGKVEFGQGIRTAFAQIVASELQLPFERVRVILADTAVVPWDVGTFGSASVKQEAPALLRAAAFARRCLLERAAARLGEPADRLTLRDGAVLGPRGKAVTYAELVEGDPIRGEIPDGVEPLPRDRWRYVGSAVARVEAHDIVTGRARYVPDGRLDGMLRGAVARPPVRGGRATAVDDRAARALPGVIAVVRSDDLVGVVAEREEQARAAVAALDITWEAAPPAEARATDVPMKADPGVDEGIAAAPIRSAATYTVPSIASASICPSAAAADVREDGATIYAATHYPFELRDEVAQRLGLPVDRVRFVGQMSAGTYGRSGSADAPLEAVILSQHARRPVLVQWTRAEEFTVSPNRPEAVLEVSAGLSADGAIVAWRYDEHTNMHIRHDRGPQVAALTSGRLAVPPYDIPSMRVVLHIEPTPLRTASFRSLAASQNVFAIESFMDELALLTSQDPLAFRLRHIGDPRLRRVVERVAEVSGYDARSRERRGLGLACANYGATYIAQVAEVDTSPSGAVRLVRVWCVIDPGLVVNPDGVRNQVEGGIQQSASWTLKEELRHRDGRVLTTSWDAYPIATFRDAPESIEVLVEGDPAAPATGVGEPGTVPVPAAIANAIAAATGARVRDLPFTAGRVRSATPQVEGRATP